MPNVLQISMAGTVVGGDGRWSLHSGSFPYAYYYGEGTRVIERPDPMNMAAAAGDELDVSFGSFSVIVASPPQYHKNNDPRGRNEGPHLVGVHTPVRASPYANVCMIFRCLHTSDEGYVGSSRVARMQIRAARIGCTVQWKHSCIS